MELAAIDSDLEWEVQQIMKRELICYDRRIGGRTRTFEELRY